MTKFVVNVPNAVSADKADALQARVAEALGVDPCCVFVLVGASLTVVDLPEPEKPAPVPFKPTGYGE